MYTLKIGKNNKGLLSEPYRKKLYSKDPFYFLGGLREENFPLNQKLAK